MYDLGKGAKGQWALTPSPKPLPPIPFGFMGPEKAGPTAPPSPAPISGLGGGFEGRAGDLWSPALPSKLLSFLGQLYGGRQVQASVVQGPADDHAYHSQGFQGQEGGDVF